MPRIDRILYAASTTHAVYRSYSIRGISTMPLIASWPSTHTIMSYQLPKETTHLNHSRLVPLQQLRQHGYNLARPQRHRERVPLNLPDAVERKVVPRILRHRIRIRQQYPVHFTAVLRISVQVPIVVRYEYPGLRSSFTHEVLLEALVDPVKYLRIPLRHVPSPFERCNHPSQLSSKRLLVTIRIVKRLSDLLQLSSTKWRLFLLRKLLQHLHTLS